jgi:hypothetical protein
MSLINLVTASYSPVAGQLEDLVKI